MKKRLKNRLIKDLNKLNSSNDYDIELRGYSKTEWGCYYPNRSLIVLYPYLSPSLSFIRPYNDLFLTALHELVHHLQYSDPDFTRYKGVMHNTEFWDLYNHYSNNYLRGKHEERETKDEKFGEGDAVTTY